MEYFEYLELLVAILAISIIVLFILLAIQSNTITKLCEEFKTKGVRLKQSDNIIGSFLDERNLNKTIKTTR